MSNRPTISIFSDEAGDQSIVYYERHSELVDKKFGVGLTKQEQVELDDINERLDNLEAPYYQPIIDFLQAALDRIKRENRKEPSQ